MSALRTYPDFNDARGQTWRITQTDDGTWEGSAAVTSLYGIQELFGYSTYPELRRALIAFVDEYGAKLQNKSSSWIWIVVAAVVLMSDGRRR